MIRLTGGGKGKQLREFLGLDDAEYEAFLHGDLELKKKLDLLKHQSVQAGLLRCACREL